MTVFNTAEVESDRKVASTERKGDSINLLGLHFDFMPGRGVDKSTTTDRPAEKIQWESNVSTALTRAQNEHKPLVVVFKEDRCGWCKVFSDELQKPEVGAIAKDAVYLQVTPSTNAEAKQLANLVKVEGYPTFSVLSVDHGNITPISKLAGFMDSNKFINHMRVAFAAARSKTATV
ncbi:hypothetical protein BH11CYA1_BH11CYA1_27780 [soil metagenome]